MKKLFLLGLVGLTALAFSCGGASARNVKRMQLMEEGVSSPSTIQEYEEAIRKFEKRIADIKLAQQQVGIWHKIVGSRYLDEKMYGEALQSYQSALQYYPDNQNLYYYVGVCAGFLSHTALDYDADGTAAEKKMRYLKLSEDSYLRAIAIEPRYVRALYALGVLYTYELGESYKAIPHLETVLSIDTGHIDAMFVLARAYCDNYEFDKAVALYDRIIASKVGDPNRKKKAEENKKAVLDASYGK